jgi:hypothetical protein
MPIGLNGGLIGRLNSSTKLNGASGIWSMGEVGINRLVGTWPVNATIVRIFYGSTTFTVPSSVTSVDYLIVAGGGGGASGGGGGGGVRQGTNFSVTPGDTISVSVGSGGAADSSNGSNSGFFSSTSPYPATWSSGGGRGGRNASGASAGRSGG